MAKTRGNTNNTKRQLPKRVPPLTVSRALGQKSPLIEADLQAFLGRCFSMERRQTYTDEERARILGCLPRSQRLQDGVVSSQRSKDASPVHSEKPVSTNGPLQPSMCPDIIGPTSLDASQISTDIYIKRAVARFQRDLGDGYYEKAWLDKARRAHQERMDGKFDEYLKQHTEEIFDDSGNLDEDGLEEEDDSLQISEDGEYMDKSRKASRGRGRLQRAK